MAYEHITFLIENNVGTITFNRPDKLNSFNRAMAREVQLVFESFAANGENAGKIRALLITGAGRAFCAGQDLAEAAPADKAWADIRSIVHGSYNPIIKYIRNLEIPVIAAVNGVAAGAGANIALACDFVIAAENASFLQAFCHIGLIPDSGGTFFLPRLIGTASATQLMMLGEKISAKQAQEWGMIYSVCSPDELLIAATGLANKLAGMPTKGLGLIKRALNQSLANNLETQLTIEEELQGLAGSTSDYHEGVSAFLEKRKPNFTGK